ncbi:vWA domain-containing protein [Micromonospora sp. CPCC 206061]|uniref:vWA domain-containing protein n=1 Tax=Micromonospora sp. CPCC 206061 TaxID=3122410 RepID=UPI002FEF55A6
MMSDSSGQPPARTTIVSAVILVALLGVATWIVEQAAEHPWRALAAALVIAFVTVVPRRQMVEIMKWVIENWKRIVPAGILLTLVALLAVLPLRPGPVAAVGCAHPAEVRVLTSVDELAATRTLVRRYERWTADHNQDAPGCPTVHAFVYAATTAAATSALARAWRPDGAQRPLVSIGPRPDVWLPDSTVDVREVRALARRAQLPEPIRAINSIGSSPVVLVTRAQVPNPAPAWSRLVPALLRGSGPALLAPDPETSTVGLLAAAAYLSGPDGKPTSLAEARQRVRATVVAGPDAGAGAGAVLCRWAGAPPDTSALASAIVSEQAWLRFMGMNPPGAECPGGPVPSGGISVAPAGTPVLDHPLVEFTWSTAAQQSVIDGFRRWLFGGNGRDAREAVHLRDARPDCSALELNPCVPADLDVTLDRYVEAQRPGRVLLALDTSGSMANVAGPAGLTRFDVAARAVVQALGQMGPRDEFGLWTFPGAGGKGQRQLARIAAGSEGHRRQIGEALHGARPAGGTPLYDTIVTGMRAVAAPAPGVDRRALLVMTDGKDTGSGTSAEVARRTVRDMAGRAGAVLFVVATGEASCRDPLDAPPGGARLSLRDLVAADLGGECFDARPDQLTATVAELFKRLWRGE